jgi:hypothetical protein
MNVDDFLQLYIAVTATLFGVSAIMLLREAKSNDFKMPFFSGTYGAYLYYKKLKSQKKRLVKYFGFIS